MCCRKFLSRSESLCWTESCLKQKCWHLVEFPHVIRFYGVSCNESTGKLWPEDAPRLWNCRQVASYIVFFTRSGYVSAKDVQLQLLLCIYSGVTFPTQSFLLCSWIRLDPSAPSSWQRVLQGRRLSSDLAAPDHMFLTEILQLLLKWPLRKKCTSQFPVWRHNKRAGT